MNKCPGNNYVSSTVVRHGRLVLLWSIPSMMMVIHFSGLDLASSKGVWSTVPLLPTPFQTAAAPHPCQHQDASFRPQGAWQSSPQRFTISSSWKMGADLLLDPVLATCPPVFLSLHAGKLTLKEKKKICMHVYRTYILLLCSIRAWHACRTRMYDMCDAFVSHLCFQIHAFRFNTRAARVLLVLCTLYTDVIVNRYHGDPQYHFIYTYIICTTTLVRLLAPEQALLTTACHNSAGVDRLKIPCMKKIM